MMLAALIAGTLLASGPDAPALGPRSGTGGTPDLLARAGIPASARALSPLLGLDTTAAPRGTPRPGFLLLGGAAALAGLALTLPTVTHPGCAQAGRCADGTQALVAGSLFLVGAGLAAAAGGAAPQPGGGVRVAGLTGAEVRERLGLDVPLGTAGPGRAVLRWSPFRLRRGGGVRVGVAF
ncbi:MAG TPA: hypothetical protein VLT82_00415 [Myxococcaceae bacterium]|nr:hypothetical protein [Myxococcaceae bacterium]